MKNDYSYRQRLLSRHDLDSLIALRNTTLAQLANPDHYVRECDETQFLLQHLGEEGATFGLFEHDRLIAYAMLGFPRADSVDNLGASAGLPPSDWQLVAHIASCMVHPACRGRHLQQVLLKARVDAAREAGRRYCVSMISLSNYPSRHNLFRSGFCISRVARFGKRLQRQMMLRDDCETSTFDLSRPVLVKAEDYDTQDELTRSGYAGISEAAPSPQRTAHIAFARRKSTV